MKHICQVCGKEFEGHFNSKICSDRCKNIKNIALHNHLSLDEVYRIGFNECKICGFLGFNLTQHIKYRHKITSKEYCEKFNCSMLEVIIEYTHNNIINAQKELYQKGYVNNFITNNPGKGHNGSMSPFSRNFIKYQGLSEEEITEKIKSLQKKSKESMIKNNNVTTRIEYYTSRGYSEEEAKQMLKDRQNTGSLNKYIERYGKEEGIKKFNERQIKWQNTLNAKSDEEKARIYKLKIEGFKKGREIQALNGGNNLGYSKISQELFESICRDNRIQKYFNDIYYATKGNRINNEYEMNLYESDGETLYMTLYFDFYVKSLNKCIEFDGTYWHSSEEVIEKDKKRDELLNSIGIKVLRIKEKDYCKDPEKTVKKCIRWILKHD